MTKRTEVPCPECGAPVTVDLDLGRSGHWFQIVGHPSCPARCDLTDARTLDAIEDAANDALEVG